VGEGGVTPLGRSLQNDQEWFPPRAPGGVAPESRETSRGTWVEEAKKCLPWALAYSCSASVLRAACCRTLQKPSLPRREGCVEQMEVNLTPSRKRRGRYSTDYRTGGPALPRCRCQRGVRRPFDSSGQGPTVSMPGHLQQFQNTNDSPRRLHPVFPGS
jgi:hypothetical protein